MNISFSINSDGYVTVHTGHSDIHGTYGHPSAAFLDMSYTVDGDRAARLSSFQDDGLLILSEKHCSVLGEAICHFVKSGYFREDKVSYNRKYRRFKMFFDEDKQLTKIDTHFRDPDVDSKRLGVASYIKTLQLNDNSKALMIYGDHGPKLVIGTQQHALDIAEALNYAIAFSWFTHV